MESRQREVSDIRSIETGIQFLSQAEKMDELHDEIGLSKNGCSFLLQHPNGLKISVVSFEDLRDGEFLELAHFGRRPNDIQRKKWIAENGMQKDHERLAEVLRQRMEGEIPDKNMTAEEVKGIISSALNDSNSSNSSSSTRY